MTNSTSTLSGIARILIVDDHPTTREGLAQYLSRCADFEISGVADDIQSALESIRQVQPDVVIVDMNLKESSGLELIKQIRKDHPTIGLLAWSMHDKALFGNRAEKAGASDYVSKMQPTEDVVTAVRAILRRSGISTDVAVQAAPRIKKGKHAKPEGAASVEDLSDRELQVFQMMGEGLNMQQMTARTQLSPKTIETYRARIKQKLLLSTNSELMRHAVQFVIEGRNRREAGV